MRGRPREGYWCLTLYYGGRGRGTNGRRSRRSEVSWRDGDYARWEDRCLRHGANGHRDLRSRRRTVPSCSVEGATVPGVKGFAALASGGYVVSGYARSTGSAIHYYNDDGWWVHGWRERYPRRNAFEQTESEITVMMAQMAGTGGPIHSLSDGSFLYSQLAPHEIVVFEESSTPENGWTERPVVSMPELFEAPGAAVVEKKTEDGQTFTSYRSAWPHSMSVFELGNGYILNVVDMGEEERWIWQVFDPQRAMDGVGAVLVAETSVDRRYGSSSCVTTAISWLLPRILLPECLTLFAYGWMHRGRRLSAQRSGQLAAYADCADARCREPRLKMPCASEMRDAEAETQDDRLLCHCRVPEVRKLLE